MMDSLRQSKMYRVAELSVQISVAIAANMMYSSCWPSFMTRMNRLNAGIGLRNVGYA